MTVRTPSTRRDFRHVLRPGAASLEYTDREGSRHTAPLVGVSVAGMAFELTGRTKLPPFGTSFEKVTLRIGRCVLGGDAVVRNTRRIAPGRIEVGCLFYPSPAEEDRWMTLIAGIEVGSGSEREPS